MHLQVPRRCLPALRRVQIAAHALVGAPTSRSRVAARRYLRALQQRYTSRVEDAVRADVVPIGRALLRISERMDDLLAVQKENGALLRYLVSLVPSCCCPPLRTPADRSTSRPGCHCSRTSPPRRTTVRLRGVTRGQPLAERRGRRRRTKRWRMRWRRGPRMRASRGRRAVVFPLFFPVFSLVSFCLLLFCFSAGFGRRPDGLSFVLSLPVLRRSC